MSAKGCPETKDDEVQDSLCSCCNSAFGGVGGLKVNQAKKFTVTDRRCVSPSRMIFKTSQKDLSDDHQFGT